MGTTRTAIRGQSGVQLGYVLVIEGYSKLITDGMPADAIAAWSGSLWTDALPGLQVDVTSHQTLAPFSNEFSVPSATFTIHGDEFATAMARKKPAVRSELTVGFDTSNHVGGFSITVQDASLFAANTPVMIGNETFSVSGTPTGTTIPVAALGSGYYHPFGVDGGTNRFPGHHSIGPNANVNNVDVNAPVYVTDSPATWIGKKVALYVHRVVGGVWDTKAQAEIWFAGTIDSVAPGVLSTVVECSDIRQSLKDAVLMQDQWSGRPAEGYTFKDGDYVSAYWANSTTTYQSLRFVAATPGTGADEFPAGRYSADEFGVLWATHLNGDETVGTESALAVRWSAGVISTDNGPRFQIVANRASASHATNIILTAGVPAILDFFGFDYPGGSGGWLNSGTVKTGTKQPLTTATAIVSEFAPIRFPSIGLSDRVQGVVLDMEDTDGTYVEHTTLLPPSAQEHALAGGSWSFYALGESVLFLGKRVSDTQIAGITTDLPIIEMYRDPAKASAALRMGRAEATRIKQVFFAADTFSSIVSKLFASIDGNAINHATHDAFPWGAGIPWSLLGSAFTNSLDALEQAGIEDSMALILDKPTRMWDAIKSDFALRMAQPVWKDGGIRIASLGVPNASLAEHTLDETNKSDDRDTQSRETSEYLTHSLKVQFGRNPLKDDEYRDERVVRNQIAYQSSGGVGNTKTIKARNSYSGIAASGAAVEAMLDVLASRHLPTFGKPLKVWTRSVPHTLFHMAPGDQVAISDDRIRDPNTGQLGITSRAGTVISMSHSLGISSSGQGYHGEVSILFSEEDRLFPSSPSAEHAQAITTGAYTNGYDSVGKEILVHQHKFSDSSEAVDSNNFAAGDAVRITAWDPAAPASASTFTDTIVSITTAAATVSTVDYDAIELTTGITPVAGVTYLVNYGAYNVAQAGQLLKSFQADDSDGQILDLIEPNLVGDNVKVGSAAADLTLLPARHSEEQFGDGAPLSVSFLRDQARMANNLTNYKTSVHVPMIIASGTPITTVTAGEYIVLWTIPLFIGNESWTGGRKRRLTVSPYFASDGASTATIRVTSSANPVEGLTFFDPTFYGPKNQITFSSASGTVSFATAQQLDVVRAQYPESNAITWITVEITNDTNSGGGVFKGLGELWLGPLE